MKFNLIILLSLIFIQSGYAQINHDENIYTIRKKDSLISIAKSYKKKHGSIFINLQSYIDEIKKWNKHIQNWSSLKSGQRIYLSYPQKVHYPFSLITPLESLNTYESQSYSFLSLAYTASFGSFVETATNGSKIKSQQNSPYTLGVSGGYGFPNSLYSINGSIYSSKLNASTVSGSTTSNNNDVTVPNELGANIYLQRSLNESSSMYTGIDYESFSTFNINDLINNASTQLSAQDNTITWATIGYQYLSSGLRPFLFKGSLSTSVTSSSNYKGQKGILFLNKKVSKNWGVHSFIKYHQLSDKTDLAVMRIGLGINFKIF